VAKSGSTPAKKRAAAAGRERELLEELNKGEDNAPAQFLGSDLQALKIRGVISTQCVTLDRAIGRGGVPLGRLTLLHGKEGSGKTTIALHLIAEAQKRGGLCVYIDAEHKLDPDYAERIGVDIARLLLVQPDYVEKMFPMVEKAVAIAKKYREQGEPFPILFVLDSINALPTKEEFEAGWEDHHVAPDARAYSSKLKKLMPILKREDVALVFVSQVREKVGVMFGSKERTGGGNAPKFYSSLILETTRTGAVKDGDREIGNLTNVRCSKNQIAPPFKHAEFKLVWGRGIDYEDSLLQEALRAGVVEKAGAWFSHKGERLGQGAANAASTLRGNPEWAARILEEVSP